MVTAVELPDAMDGGEDAEDHARQLRHHRHGGQNQLKGRIMRIAHCGYYGGFDILTAVAGLETMLRELGAERRAGSRRGRRTGGVPRSGLRRVAPASDCAP